MCIELKMKCVGGGAREPLSLSSWAIGIAAFGHFGAEGPSSRAAAGRVPAPPELRFLYTLLACTRSPREEVPKS